MKTFRVAPGDVVLYDTQDWSPPLVEAWLRGYDRPVLKVDTDHKRLLPVERLRSRLARANRSLAWWVVEPSPSGRGWHSWLAVTPDPKTAVEMVALQLLCGSDPLREAYNLNRALRADALPGSVAVKAKDWNVFYKR